MGSNLTQEDYLACIVTTALLSMKGTTFKKPYGRDWRGEDYLEAGRFIAQIIIQHSKGGNNET